MKPRKWRMGMVGGGIGAFIGAVHRMAAQLDGAIELVCGAFSSDPHRSRESGLALGVLPERSYRSWEEMFVRELLLPPTVRMDFVSIVTPNHLHFPIAEAALQAGFPVVCDKPLCRTLDEARKLFALARQTKLPFCVTYNYSGYPLVKHARWLVLSGKLGRVRKVVVEYPQGWLARPIEREGQKQASWRTNPEFAGLGGAIGDIGTHAAHLAEYVTGQRITHVCADLTSFVEGRVLDDDASVLLRFSEGARGILHASQVCIDEENGLSIRVYGTEGGLEWHQEEPNTLILKWPNRPREIVRAGVNSHADLAPAARAACRLPLGHPEGFIEAFANVYRGFTQALACRAGESVPDPQRLDYPTVEEGARGVAFVEAVIRSAKSDAAKWVPVADLRSEEANP
ncbi:MAG: Gfo/Idh/MocA family oxidoreductase [Candidatus Sumerlaea chitinivorans]|nr:Gfo/Idh/MocA family oxidoreductase [Candidatus Sumerlaea chitinivorans]